MGIFEAIVLGLVQGITEFLPVSSTGHLVLVREWLVVNTADGLAVDAVLHLATTAAVVLYFWGDLWRLLQTVLRRLGRLPVNPQEWELFRALVVATVPAVVVGVLLESYIAEYTRSAWLVASFLALAAIGFMYAEWRHFLEPRHGSVTLLRGFKIGLFQVLALLPGISRSGVTLAGGMWLGMTRIEAARFSFLLAIPITLGVGIKKLIDLIALGESVAWVPVLVGAGVSFVSALVVIHFFLAFIRRYTLWPFVWYSLALAGLVGYLAWLG
jgi:undecaprenyl-diphosphatase